MILGALAAGVCDIRIRGWCAPSWSKSIRHVSRNFSIDAELPMCYRLVADLLRGNWCNGFWPLPC